MTRKLNVNEHLSWIISRSTAHNVLIVTRTNSKLEQASLKEAVNILVNKNPILKYFLHSEKPAFERHFKTNFPIQFIKLNKDWRFFAEEELNSEFLPNSFLARLSILEEKNGENIILFCFHHAIGDVFSAFHFVCDLLAVATGQKKIIKCPRSQEVTDKLPDFIKYYPEVNKRNSFCEKNNKRTGAAYIAFDQSEYGKVIEKAKRYSCTMTGLITAATAEILSKYIHDKKDHINICVGVNARADLLSTELSFVTSWLDIPYFVSNYSTMEEAACFLSNEIKESISQEKPEKNLAEACKVINEHNNNDFLKLLCTKGTNNYFFISSMGKFESNNAEIKEMYAFASCQAHMQSENSFFLCVTSLNNQGMFMTFSYPANYMNHEKADNMLKCLQQRLVEES